MARTKLIRPMTQRVFDALMLDMWPDSPAAVTDFGLASQGHYAALQNAVRSGAITAEQLDALLGDGPGLTEAVNAAVGNPHPGIVFATPYDVL